MTEGIFARNPQSGSGARAVSAFHKNADTDGSTKAIHHTLGSASNQASPGNHTHDGGQSATLDGYADIAHDHNAAYDARYMMANVAWATLAVTGGWTAFGSGYIGPQIRKVGDIVYLRGMIKHATVTTTGTIYTFPAGQRPIGGIIPFVCVAAHTGFFDGLARFNVDTSGVLSIVGYGPSSDGSFIDLSRINFSTVA